MIRKYKATCQARHDAYPGLQLGVIKHAGQPQTRRVGTHHHSPVSRSQVGQSACTFTTPDINMSFASTKRNGHAAGAAGCRFSGCGSGHRAQGA